MPRRASTAASADASTVVRSDAGARRNSRVATSASASTIAPRAISKIGDRIVMSAALLLGLGDECSDPIQLLRRQLASRRLDQRRNCVLDRAVEERIDEVRDRRSLRLAARDGGRVDVARAVLLVSHELGAVADDLDRVIVLRHGRVFFDGPPAELAAAGVSLGVHREDLPLWLEELERG